MKKIIVLLALVCPVLLWGQNYKAKRDDDSGKYGYVDESGKWVISPKFRYAMDFDGEYARVQKEDADNTHGLINKTGKEVVPCKYEFVLVSPSGFPYVSITNHY